MHLKKLISALFLALALLLPTAGAQASPDPLETIGTMGSMSTLDVMRLLKHSRGKVVVLNFWASWCSPCRAEVPELMHLRKTFSEDELLILGLNVDTDVAAYAKFVTDTGFTYPVRRADEGVQRLFRISTIPRLLVYNPKGELVVDHEGVAPANELGRVIKTLLSEK